eukprot:CAMPEP_0170172032 /NCGR_PEP_ID=MMETSP0040_2-20121228/5255_1 /TAXON_ID=641309 /ORGANISM="Lotharella oceanica, Strain CCMP622" /LENGTH=40 /DNA_ID= /DNA_START= /DNA_END= /DNA_ORIENTATION=
MSMMATGTCHQNEKQRRSGRPATVGERGSRGCGKVGDGCG